MTGHLPRDQRREQILDAASQLFVERGYENSSVDEIARVAGLSKGSIYWYFDGKLDILFALTDRYVEESQSEVVGLASEDKYGTEALYRAHRDLHEEKQKRPEKDKLLSQLMGLAARYPEIRARMSSYYRKWDEVTMSLVQDAVERGKFHAVDSKALAQAICALYDGLSMRRQLDPDIDIVHVVETIMKLAHEALTQNLPVTDGVFKTAPAGAHR